MRENDVIQEGIVSAKVETREINTFFLIMMKANEKNTTLIIQQVSVSKLSCKSFIDQYFLLMIPLAPLGLIMVPLASLAAYSSHQWYQWQPIAKSPMVALAERQMQPLSLRIMLECSVIKNSIQQFYCTAVNTQVWMTGYRFELSCRQNFTWFYTTHYVAEPSESPLSWYIWNTIERDTQQPNEPWHDKTNKMSVRPAKIWISLGIHPVSNGSFRPLSRSPRVVLPWVVSPPRVVLPSITWVISPSYPESFRPLFDE